MMQLKYKAETRSRKNEKIEIQIFQKAVSPFVVQDIQITELSLEWGEVDKIEPVMSSSATLTIVSKTDRQLVDLYTVEAGSVRMDVLLNNKLYWSGTLDPELYEEPYSYKEEYDVTLTFTDFAILSRKQYTLTGFVSFEQLVETCLQESGIQYDTIKKHISTKLDAALSTTVYDDTSYLSDNFYDEDGVAMTLREVLDALLQPYALQLRQKNGHVYIYDLNALSSAFSPTEIVWDSNDARLEVDKVYNNVKVSFSPYENDDLLRCEIDRKSITSTRKISIGVPGERFPGFDIEFGNDGSGCTKGTNCKFFKITSTYSGSDCEGIAHTIMTWNGSANVNQILPATATIGSLAMQPDQKVYLGKTTQESRANLRLKVQLDLLFDVRINPFEAASNPNEEGNFKRLKDWCNFAYVPVLITLRDETGRAICHWRNDEVKNSGGYDHTSRNARWVSGEGTWGAAWLCWYNFNNRKNETGLGDWQTNRKIIGYYRGDLPTTFNKLGTGEYIDLPSATGWLELKIGTGLIQWDYEQEIKDIYSRTRWVLYKNPTITLCDKWGQSVKREDVEYAAWINRNAKEELSIDTLIGTMSQPSPVAKGQILRSYDKSVVGELSRGNYRNRLEKLLIGTIYSNYASRNIVLSGTCEILHDFGTYTESNAPGSYVMLAEKQDLHACTSELKIITFNPDNYDAINYQ